MTEILLLTLCSLLVEIFGVFLLITLKFMKENEIKSNKAYLSFIKSNLRNLIITVILIMIGNFLVIYYAIK